MSEYLPQDIVMKILSRLPPKSLIKFRCVSKSWYLMISTPYFINLHTQHALLSPKMMLLRRYSKLLQTDVYSVHAAAASEFDYAGIQIEYPFRDRVRFYYRIVGCFNGVVCLLDDQFGQPDAVAIQLWNPAIRRKLTLPPPPSSVNEDPSMSMVALGFGFNAERSDYKVVRISYLYGDCEYLLPPRVEVYALSSGRWHTVEGEIPHNCVVEYFWSQVFTHGNVHWVAYKTLGKKNSKRENLIMSFDMIREVFDEMLLPEPLENEVPLNLGALDLGGVLAVVQYDERVCGMRCSIWAMRVYGDVGSWSRDYAISLGCGIGRVLGAKQNGDVLLATKAGALVAYSGVDGKCEDLCISGTKDSFYAGTYNESLALLNEGDVARHRLPSDSESESGSESGIEYQSSIEDEDEDGEDCLGDVEKSEFRMQGSMSQYLSVFFRRPFV
ncbi:hypothetical protein SASPL_127786 [Salvia splendens]|uniref:F-box domain-containing protein n=1 Tax=Salvia splendens TaxID=180675 RepID=A0A8X8XBH9_SALSN|nr:F-box/kelch-repeat protein At3g23880-like [Salvia splendens]KAG6409744.1 hypothetical protein SASPL_127786 [Salvia splendens]